MLATPRDQTLQYNLRINQLRRKKLVFLPIHSGFAASRLFQLLVPQHSVPKTRLQLRETSNEIGVEVIDDDSHILQEISRVEFLATTKTT